MLIHIGVSFIEIWGDTKGGAQLPWVPGNGIIIGACTPETWPYDILQQVSDPSFPPGSYAVHLAAGSLVALCILSHLPPLGMLPLFRL